MIRTFLTETYPWCVPIKWGGGSSAYEYEEGFLSFSCRFSRSLPHTPTRADRRISTGEWQKPKNVKWGRSLRTADTVSQNVSHLTAQVSLWSFYRFPIQTRVGVLILWVDNSCSHQLSYMLHQPSHHYLCFTFHFSYCVHWFWWRQLRLSYVYATVWVYDMLYVTCDILLDSDTYWSMMMIAVGRLRVWSWRGVQTRFD